LKDLLPRAPDAPPAASVLIDAKHRQNQIDASAWASERIELAAADFAERMAVMRAPKRHPTKAVAAQVRYFGALGIAPRLVARWAGMTELQLLGFYAEEFEAGQAAVNVMVGANLIRLALGNDRNTVKAAVEVMNRRGGTEWRQRKVIEDKPASESPTEERAGIIDASTLTPEQRQQLRDMIQQRTGTPAAPSQVTGGLVPTYSSGGDEE
jgi:hypothetical protein